MGATCSTSMSTSPSVTIQALEALCRRSSAINCVSPILIAFSAICPASQDPEQLQAKDTQAAARQNMRQDFRVHTKDTQVTFGKEGDFFGKEGDFFGKDSQVTFGKEWKKISECDTGISPRPMEVAVRGTSGLLRLSKVHMWWVSTAS